MTHDEAREHVKDHLYRSGEKKNCAPTKRMIMLWWNILNDAVFYGRLHRPRKIRIDRLRGVWARMEENGFDKNHNPKINLEMNDLFATKRMFLATLIHEMVHAWEYQHHSRTGHGKRFYAWKNRIKRTAGLHLDGAGVCESDYIDEED